MTRVTQPTFQTPPRPSPSLFLPRSWETWWDGEEMMGGEETDHNIKKHLVKNYEWMGTFSFYQALP